jgi:hypothetical protein
LAFTYLQLFELQVMTLFGDFVFAAFAIAG